MSDLVQRLRETAKLEPHTYACGYLQEAADEIERLTEENAELRAKCEVTYCAYCGQEFPIDGESGTDAISEHLGVCAKHPMREVLRVARQCYREISNIPRKKAFGAQYPWLEGE
jgi:hypothetical protein